MALIPLDTRVLLTAKPAEVDFANSINTGMELGNKIQQARQQKGLAHLLGNPAAYNANGQLDTNQAMGLIQQNYSGGLAGALRQQVAKYAQDQQKAALDAEKARADMLKASSDAANTQQKTQIDRMRAINGSLAGALSGDPRNTEFMLGHARAAGFLDDDTYSRTMEFLRANANDPKAISSLVKSLGIAGAQNPEQYLMPDANNANTNQTSLTNNALDNTTKIDMNTDDNKTISDNNAEDNRTRIITTGMTTATSSSNNANTVNASLQRAQIAGQAKGRETIAQQNERVATGIRLSQAASEAARASKAASDLISHSGIKWGTGWTAASGLVPSTDAKAFRTDLENLKAQLFLPTIQQMRGMGALSNAEGAKVEAAVQNLDPSVGEDEMKRRLSLVAQGMSRLAQMSAKESKLYSQSGRNTGGAGNAGKNRAAPSLDSILFD